MTQKGETSVWPAFLPAVEKAVDRALKAVGLQEQTLASLEQTQTMELDKTLDSVRDRTFGLKTYSDRSDQAVAQFDGFLRTSEDEIRNYLHEIEVMQQRLANWSGGAVG